ncbi:633_t:CDS:2 [Cetraspora pellucida]|uniref:633_t:CDS:1 n=1 Tax=Cetraspora pellucida TaxID=1433469 RepID=A0ACA9K1C7_9GLOM|nr:633_t:CDS:2 [Cetraspora pellucida]
MIRFSKIACIKRIEFIRAKLINKILLDIWCPITIIYNKIELQKTKSFLTKSQILSIINTLTLFLDNSDQLCFHGLSNKFCKNLNYI